MPFEHGEKKSTVGCIQNTNVTEFWSLNQTVTVWKVQLHKDLNRIMGLIKMDSDFPNMLQLILENAFTPNSTR